MVVCIITMSSSNELVVMAPYGGGWGAPTSVACEEEI